MFTFKSAFAKMFKCMLADVYNPYVNTKTLLGGGGTSDALYGEGYLISYPGARLRNNIQGYIFEILNPYLKLLPSFNMGDSLGSFHEKSRDTVPSG